MILATLLALVVSRPASALTIFPPGSFEVHENVVSPEAPLHVSWLFWPADLSSSSRVHLTVYNSAGEFICTMFDADIRRLTRYEAVWSCTTDSGRRVSPGVYILQAVTPAFVRRYRVAVSGA